LPASVKRERQLPSVDDASKQDIDAEADSLLLPEHTVQWKRAISEALALKAKPGTNHGFEPGVAMRNSSARGNNDAGDTSEQFPLLPHQPVYSKKATSDGFMPHVGRHSASAKNSKEAEDSSALFPLIPQQPMPWKRVTSTGSVPQLMQQPVTWKRTISEGSVPQVEMQQPVPWKRTSSEGSVPQLEMQQPVPWKRCSSDGSVPEVEMCNTSAKKSQEEENGSALFLLMPKQPVPFNQATCARCPG
jgi:hypothetical protein